MTQVDTTTFPPGNHNAQNAFAEAWSRWMAVQAARASDLVHHAQGYTFGTPGCDAAERRTDNIADAFTQAARHLTATPAGNIDQLRDKVDALISLLDFEREAGRFVDGRVGRLASSIRSDIAAID